MPESGGCRRRIQACSAASSTGVPGSSWRARRYSACRVMVTMRPRTAAAATAAARLGSSCRAGGVRPENVSPPGSVRARIPWTRARSLRFLESLRFLAHRTMAPSTAAAAALPPASMAGGATPRARPAAP